MKEESHHKAHFITNLRDTEVSYEADYITLLHKHKFEHPQKAEVNKQQGVKLLPGD